MKRNSIIIIFSITFFLATPFFFGGQLVTAAGLADLAGCSGPDCGTCEVMKMANGLIMWLIGFVFLLFALLFMRAGVNLVTSGGNPGALQSAKDSFINALIGLIIILAAWLIVDTLMKSLVGKKGDETSRGFLNVQGDRDGWLLWSQIECTEQNELTVCTKDNDCKVDVVLDGHDGDTSDVPDGEIGRNCSGEAISLKTISGTSFQARTDVANDFERMRTAAAEDGVTLTITSAYRSDAEQVEIWNRHNCTPATCSGLVGKPCSLGGNGSNHNKGEAFDISTDGGALQWLEANAGRYGLYNNLPNDRVHWSRSGG